MKNFDSHRFRNLMRYELTANKRNIINTMLIMTLALTFVYVSTTIRTLHDNVNYNMNNLLWGLVTSTTSIYVLFATLGASRIFYNMRRKQDRINFLTLPATNVEKFMARYLYATVGYLLMYTGSAVVADVLNRIMAYMLYSVDVGSVCLHGMEGLFDMSMLVLIELIRHDNEQVEIILTILLVVFIVLLCGSMYIFGGSFFRRNQWVLTTFSMTVVSIALTTASTMLLHVSNTEALSKSELLVLIMFADLLLPLLIVGLHCLAWKLFCRTQVITGEWTNL